jgi:hypothetical protein
MMSGPSPQQPDSQLRRRRDALAEQVAELHWNLGGLAYEMAIRDHFRLDVLIRRAAMLQECDAELAEVERMLHMQESGTVGDCPNCGAVRSRGAVFCWQCGTQVMEQARANGDFGRQDPLDDRRMPASPVAAPAGRDRAFDSGREGIAGRAETRGGRDVERGGGREKTGHHAETHPIDVLTAAEPVDRGEVVPVADLGRPVQTSS